MLGLLIRAAGEEAALLIIENWPGVRVFIPKTSKVGQKLSTIIGLEPAKALSAEFGGMTIKAPLARSWRCRVYFERGWTNPQIARTIGVSDNSVVRILASLGLSRSRAAMPLQITVPAVGSNCLVPAE